MGLNEKKSFPESGNGMVFRGSVQHLRAFFGAGEIDPSRQQKN
jgi:hypothetical protein